MSDFELTELEYEGNAWDRQQDEPNLWYERFVIFRDLGPDRSLEAAYQAYEAEKQQKAAKSSNSASPPKMRPKRPSGAWYENCNKWQWRERAELYDEYQRLLKARELQEERDADKRERIRVYRSLRHRMVQALATADPDEAGWYEIINGITKAQAGLREEYDDLPTMRMEGGYTMEGLRKAWQRTQGQVVETLAKFGDVLEWGEDEA